MLVAFRGHVLVHEIAPGGVPEPTMIYLEDDRLTLIHYCEAGNRPRLVVRKSPDQDNTVEFNFVAISAWVVSAVDLSQVQLFHEDIEASPGGS